MKKSANKKSLNKKTANSPQRPIPAPALVTDQIRGRLASMRSELATLEREHADDQTTFQERTAKRLKRHNELTGGIAALQALVSE